MARRTTFEEFVEKSEKLYGCKYKIVRDTYTCVKNKVKIICPEHGEFWKQGYVFLKGCECTLCSNKQKSIKQTKTTEQFLKEYNEKFPNSPYSTEKVDYKGDRISVTMICPIHGDFEIKPNKLLIGQGCRDCGMIRSHNKQTKTLEKFIEDANKVHNHYYKYNNAVYVNKNTKLYVTCPVHGDFPITPDNHLRGKGCPKCRMSHLERNVMNNLDKYSIKYEYEKKFDWLKYRNPMSLDFYLEDYNVAIECQGIEHFKPISFSYSIDSDRAAKIFKGVQTRDKLKKELCESHGLKLFYINYNNEEDDNNKLIEFLNNGRR